jgi:uncharacterized protein (TIGR00290 family)
VENVLVSWSGGKDCALAMYEVLVGGEYQVVGLLTTVTRDSDRVDMHDIRCSLIERQAQALGLPWEKVSVSSHTSNADWEPELVQALRRYRESGVTSVVFGDIFREDLRKYRAVNLARLGMKAIFPLWKRDNLQLMDSFISLGFKAIVTSINACRLDDRFVGRTLDWQFMRDFPASANICGEYGEYHTFVYDGPIFESAIPYTLGDLCERDDDFHHFMFRDVIPA